MRHMRHIYKIILTLLLLYGISLQAQLQTSHWYFGANAGLDFTSGNPIPDLNGQIASSEGIASISDEHGNLLFYTDGVTVYTRNHTIMPNGTNLYGHKSSTQSALIIPAPENENLYYILTTDAFENFIIPPLGSESKGLNYSVVDMSQGTDGEVITNNVNLLPISSECVTAVAKEDCSGYWIISHYFGKFYVYSLTSSGLDPTPIITSGGFNSIAPNIGYLKASHDGKRLAFASHSESASLRIYDFNNDTGAISNQTILYTLPRQYYGVEFSPDNQILYASTSKGLYQYDLNANPISDSEVELANEPNGLPIALQLGLDGKIYYAKAIEFQTNDEYLSVINNPNNLTNPDYEADALYLGGKKHANGLPNFVPYLFHIKTFINGVDVETEFCGGVELDFSYCHVNKDFIESAIIHWDFGDGTTSSNENPVHTYTTPGTYTVILSVTIGGKTYTSETEITIHPLPDVQYAELDKCVLQGEEAEFDLTESYPQINSNEEENLTYTFHLSEEDAENNADPQQINYSTTSSTTLWVRVENEWGCVSIVQLDLIVNPIPEFTIIENPVEICTGSTATLEVTTDVSNTVNWYESDGMTLAHTGNPFTTPELTETTTYWAEVVSPEGCPSEKEEVTVEIVSAPDITIDTPVMICYGQTATLTAQTNTSNTVEWYDSETATTPLFVGNPYITPELTSDTTYWVQATGGADCQSERITVIVEVIPIPELTLPIIPEICQNETTTITITTTSGTVNWYYEETDVTPFHTGETYTTPPLSNSTTYWIEAIDGDCKSQRESITITVNELPTITANPTNPICVGTSTELSVITNGTIVNWYDSLTSTTPIFTGNPFTTEPLSNSTTYYVEAESADGCKSERIAVTATVTDELIPEFDFQLEYCVGETPDNLPTTSDNDVPGTWFPDEIQTNEEGEFTFTFTPNISCAQTITKTITVTNNKIPEFADIPQSYCVNAPAPELPDTSENGVQGTWYPSEINTSIQGATVYTFTPSEDQCGEEYQLTVTVYPHPEMELDEDIVICEGGSFDYTAPDGFDSYVWKNQSGEIISETQEVTFTEEGIYTLTVVINEIPCPLSRDIEVSFSTTPVITEIKSTENTLTVYATGNGPFEYSINNVFWQSSNTFYNLQPGIYFVYVRDKKGCGTAAKQGAIMGVPNFISPNGDGYNDTWKIRALEAFPNTRLQIFDRYGKQFVNRILEGDFEWNGKYNGEPLPSGSYWYILILETGEKISGHINLRNY